MLQLIRTLGSSWPVGWICWLGAVSDLPLHEHQRRVRFNRAEEIAAELQWRQRLQNLKGAHECKNVFYFCFWIFIILNVSLCLFVFEVSWVSVTEFRFDSIYEQRQPEQQSPKTGWLTYVRFSICTSKYNINTAIPIYIWVCENM